MGLSIGEIVLIILIIGLSALDLFANTISLVPVIGDLIETFSETILEVLQILLTILLAILSRE